MTLATAPLSALVLLITGALTWLFGLLATLVLGIRALAQAMRPRPGRHRATAPTPGTEDDDTEALAEHSGPSMPLVCSAERRPTLHHVHADGTRSCWTCGAYAEGGDR